MKLDSSLWESASIMWKQRVKYLKIIFGTFYTFLKCLVNFLAFPLEGKVKSWFVPHFYHTWRQEVTASVKRLPLKWSSVLWLLPDYLVWTSPDVSVFFDTFRWFKMPNLYFLSANEHAFMFWAETTSKKHFACAFDLIFRFYVARAVAKPSTLLCSCVRSQP